MAYLTDDRLRAANMAYTKVLFPECSERQLADEWDRMPLSFRVTTQNAMLAAIEAALGHRDDPRDELNRHCRRGWRCLCLTDTQSAREACANWRMRP